MTYLVVLSELNVRIKGYWNLRQVWELTLWMCGIWVVFIDTNELKRRSYTQMNFTKSEGTWQGHDVNFWVEGIQVQASLEVRLSNM